MTKSLSIVVSVYYLRISRVLHIEITETKRIVFILIVVTRYLEDVNRVVVSCQANVLL